MSSWIRIGNPDPDTDPGTPLNSDPIRIRFRIWIHSIALKEPNSYFVEAHSQQTQAGINKWASLKMFTHPSKHFANCFFSHRAAILSEEMNLVDDDESDVTDKVPGLPGARHAVPLLWRGDDNAGSGDGPKREIE